MRSTCERVRPLFQHPQRLKPDIGWPSNLSMFGRSKAPKPFILLAAIRQGNPVVSTPTRDNFPRPVMERYCGLKSLSAFERTATHWAISQHDGQFHIYEWRRSERQRGREKADETEVILPGDTPIETVALRAAEIAMAEPVQR